MTEIKLAPHFALTELVSSEMGTHLSNLRKTAEYCEIIRSAIGSTPLRVTSGYRTPEHNRAVRGARNSLHLVGKAVDLHSIYLPPTALYRVIAGLIAKGTLPAGGLGLYTDHVHYDWRGANFRWRR